MFCPICKSEYREGFTICKDCRVPLVPENPPEPKPQEDSNIVKLYSPRNLMEQSLIQSILDSEGIIYYIHNDLFGSMEVGPQIALFNTDFHRVFKRHFSYGVQIILRGL